ncbi:MAG: hypothetical protein ACTS27_10675, partial [Phycisphaerales bacterium]
MHMSIGVLPVSMLLAAACLAQGTWPDDPWTDYRSIQSDQLWGDGRAVAFAGTTIISSGYSAAN